MEEVEVDINELPPELSDYLADLSNFLEELIARGTGAPFITMTEYLVIITKYDEICLGDAINLKEVRRCEFEVVAMAKPNVDFYLVIDPRTYKELVGGDALSIPRELVDEVGGEEVYLMVADVLDRVVGYLFTLGIAMLGRAVKLITPEKVMDFMQPKERVEKMIRSWGSSGGIKVFVKV